MKIDMHVHSSYSEDGHTSPVDIIEDAKKKGLGGIAITDHDKFDAFEDVKDRDDFIIIPGEEVSSKKGHILAYGIDRHIRKHMSIKDTIDAIHDAGGVAIAAHPYRQWTGLGGRRCTDIFDGIEARNARSTWNANRRSKNLADRLGKMQVAGSDSHRPNTLGHGYIEVPDTCRTWQDVLEAIKNGHVTVYSTNRKWHHSLRYIGRSMFNWTKRGFRNM